MLNLISNIRLNRVKSQAKIGFRKNLENFETSELISNSISQENLFSSEAWLKIYREQ